MDWNEVTRIEVRGSTIVVKDAMTMLDADQAMPEWPSIACSAGEYILEIHVPEPFHAHRARIRRIGSNPVAGNEIGSVDVDHGFVGFIDYESFRNAVAADADAYEEWTMMELDDELALNFSGEIAFCGEKLVYVKSGDGDGSYTVYELLEDGESVGIECVFIGPE